MSGVWGNNIKVSIFGESHGTGIGITIDGLPSGVDIDLDKVYEEMKVLKELQESILCLWIMMII